MQGIRRIRKRIIISVLLICFLMVQLRSVIVLADERDVQIVKVGWFQSDMFQEGTADDEEKDGYCYDYLQTIANYTTWKFEYVYGDWTELYHMLINGEIDCLGGVSYTEEREDLMLFPDTAMGTDQYYLYKHDDDTSIDANNLSTLDGKKVGGIIDNRTTAFTEQWIKENNIDMQIVYFESFEAQQEAFKKGELDLLGQTIYNVLSIDGLSVIAKVGEEPFYLAINKNRRDLLSELNAAVTSMTSTDPFILQDMQYENYGSTLNSKTLTEAEERWINNNASIEVGYLDNYLPYSGTEKNGKPVGLMTDVLEAIVKSLGIENEIQINYKAYDNYDQMVTALQNKEINIAFPVYGNLWRLEQDGIDASSVVVSSSETFYYSGNYDKSSIKVIAVNENNRMQIEYSKRNFPQADLLMLSSADECLIAVLGGTADGTVINTLRSEIVSGNSKYRTLSSIQLADGDERCFGVREGEVELLQILNRGLGLIGSSYGIDNSYKYMGELSSYGTIDFLRDNLWEVVFIVMLVIIVIISLLGWNLIRQASIVKQKEEHIQEIDAINVELEELRREAEAANNAKTSFLFNMSHDIRTPMNAIIGFRELAVKYQDDPIKRNDYLKKIEDASMVLLSIINNVLEMARIEKGKIELEESPVSVEDFNNSLFSVFDELMSQKGITFTRKVDIKNDYVYCDQIKLREIYLNILSNAYKYTNSGGRVDMHLEEQSDEREGWLLYKTTISDTGIGMDEDYLPHLFEEFSREKNSTENKIEGTGLGMPIVKQLVELMNGTIEVTSTKDVGTTFVVTIPHRIAENPKAVESNFKNYDPQNFVGKRILLTEDNDLNAEIAITILEDVGFIVDRAENGRLALEAIEKADIDYYDLVLMDVQMPVMNGYDATRAIRALEDKAKASIPIIAMTANAFEEDKLQAIQSGMNGHLAKPIYIDELFGELSKTFKSK